MQSRVWRTARDGLINADDREIDEGSLFFYSKSFRTFERSPYSGSATANHISAPCSAKYCNKGALHFVLTTLGSREASTSEEISGKNSGQTQEIVTSNIRLKNKSQDRRQIGRPWEQLVERAGIVLVIYTDLT